MTKARHAEGNPRVLAPSAMKMAPWAKKKNTACGTAAKPKPRPGLEACEAKKLSKLLQQRRSHHVLRCLLLAALLPQPTAASSGRAQPPDSKI